MLNAVVVHWRSKMAEQDTQQRRSKRAEQGAEQEGAEQEGAGGEGRSKG